MIIGLTGGYCAGKNAVAAILERLGWTCIDVDRLGHEAIDLAREAIVARFGPGVLGRDGLVDRKAVASIVFADPAALADQEAIVHPIAIRLLDERIAAAESVARADGRSGQPEDADAGPPEGAGFGATRRPTVRCSRGR